MRLWLWDCTSVISGRAPVADVLLELGRMDAKPEYWVPTVEWRRELLSPVGLYCLMYRV